MSPSPRSRSLPGLQWMLSVSMVRKTGSDRCAGAVPERYLGKRAFAGPHRTAGSHRLTQEDEEAGQDGDEGTPAQSDREHVGLRAAGQDVAAVVTAAHLDSQRARAAQHWLPVVRYQDGQVEDALLLLPEARPPG